MNQSELNDKHVTCAEGAKTHVSYCKSRGIHFFLILIDLKREYLTCLLKVVLTMRQLSQNCNLGWNKKKMPPPPQLPNQ